MLNFLNGPASNWYQSPNQHYESMIDPKRQSYIYKIADRFEGLHHKSRNSSNRFDPYRNPYERLDYHNKAGDTMKKVHVKYHILLEQLMPMYFQIGLLLWKVILRGMTCPMRVGSVLLL